MHSFTSLIKTEWRLLLFGFAMTFGSSLGQTFFIGLFSGEIRTALNLSHGDFGLIYSAATLASAVILLWSGSLVDRLDLRHYAYLVSAGLAAGCVLLASSQHLLMLFISLLILRHMGQGLMTLAGSTTMVRYLPHHKGKANAIAGVGYSLSEAVLPPLVVLMLAVLSWRETFIAWAALLILVVPFLTWRLLGSHDQRHAAYMASVDNDAPSTEASAGKQWTRNEVLKDPLFYLFLPAIVAIPMLFTGFIFHQIHLVEEKGWSLPAWASLYLLYAIVSSLTKLFVGPLVDRIGAIRLVPLMCLPITISMLALASADGMWVAVAFMSLLALAIGIYATTSAPFFADMYGTRHLGSIKSLSMAAMVFASAITPVLMGWLIDAEVSMSTMAWAGALYTLLASGLAAIAAHKKLRV